MSRVWAHSRCTGTELLTVLALGDWADDDGWCWPSLPKLAKKTRVTVSQLCKILTAIEQRTGEVYRERSSGGQNRRTRYRVSIDENSVTDNSVAGNSVADNSVIHASQTVSPTRGAIIHHRSVNKRESKSPVQSSAVKKSQKSRIPVEQLELTDSLRAWCDTEGISCTVAEAELPKFIDWHLANGKTRKDPEAAFRNWLRKAPEFRREGSNGRQPGEFVG